MRVRKSSDGANPTETADERRVPYRHPQPEHSPPELVIPDAVPADERLWVPQADNRDRLEPAASPAMPPIPPKAEVNSER